MNCEHDPEGQHVLKFTWRDQLKLFSIALVPLIAVLGFWGDMRVFRSQFDEHREVYRQDRSDTKEQIRSVGVRVEKLQDSVSRLRRAHKSTEDPDE